MLYTERVTTEEAVRQAIRAVVERATRRRQQVDADSADAMREQADAIRDALAAGIGVAELVRITGLTRARIYQIRDGRR
jgi:hypothetical protein